MVKKTVLLGPRKNHRMCQTSSSKRSCMLNIFHDIQGRLHHFGILFLSLIIKVAISLVYLFSSLQFVFLTPQIGPVLLYFRGVKELALLLMRDGAQTLTVIGACIAVVWKALIWSRRYCSWCLFAQFHVLVCITDVTSCIIPIVM